MKVGEYMARPRKIKSPKELLAKWEEFKQYCDNKTAICHEFSSNKGTFVSVELKKPITYTIEGFCVFVGISRQSFYDYYANDKRYADIVTCMKEECEFDARGKFEQGTIPTQLSGLWMSKYGYTNKQETTSSSTVTVSDNILEALNNTAVEDWNEDIEDETAENNSISI